MLSQKVNLGKSPRQMWKKIRQFIFIALFEPNGYPAIDQLCGGRFTPMPLGISD